MTCPDPNDLLAWALGNAEKGSPVAAHVDGCVACQRVFSELLGSDRTDRLIPDHLERTTPLGLGLSLSPADAEPEDVPPGDLLGGKYTLQRKLGEGGMGTVYAALHHELNTPVALKFVKADQARNPEAVSRFRREARAAAKLTSPHVCRVMDFDTLPTGMPYIVMELLEGESLGQRLRREGSVAEPLALRWVGEALEALKEAHQLGIVHRDIKPDNLFLQRTPRGDSVKILDFGVARSAHPEIEHGLSKTMGLAMVGSPVYMSPEQFLGATADPRSDLWAIGCTLYALLTGKPPFVGPGLLPLARAVAKAAPARLPEQVSPGVARFVERCLEKDPAARFQTADEALVAVRALQVAPRARRSLALPVAAAVVAVALAGAVALRLVPTAHPDGAREAAAPPHDLAQARPLPPPAVEAPPTPAPGPVAAAAPVQAPPSAPAKATVEKKQRERRPARPADEPADSLMTTQN